METNNHQPEIAAADASEAVIEDIISAFAEAPEHAATTAVKFQSTEITNGSAVGPSGGNGGDGIENSVCLNEDNVKFDQNDDGGIKDI